MSISSRALSITGIDDRRYWNFIPNDESRCFLSTNNENLTWQFSVIMLYISKFQNLKVEGIVHV